MTVKIARLAVLTGVFPICEVFRGGKYVVNQPEENKALLPVEEYLNLQGRFSHLTDKDINIIQRNVEQEWEILLKKVKEYKRN